MSGFKLNDYNDSYNKAVAAGNIPLVYPVQKTGEVGTLTTTPASPAAHVHIWEGGATTPNPIATGTQYPWDFADAAMYAVSNSASDTGSIKAWGQRAGGLTAAVHIGAVDSWNVTLAGQTPVAFSTNPLHVLEGRAFFNNVGIIYIFRGGSATGGVPDNASDVRAVILPGVNKTQMVVYAVPDEYVAFVDKGEAAQIFETAPATSNESMRVGFRTIPNTVTSSAGTYSFLEKKVPVLSEGTSFFANEVPHPPVLAAGTKVMTSVEYFSSPAGVTSELLMTLKHQSLVSREKLIEIGQPGVV